MESRVNIFYVLAIFKISDVLWAAAQNNYGAGRLKEAFENSLSTDANVMLLISCIFSKCQLECTNLSCRYSVYSNKLIKCEKIISI